MLNPRPTSFQQDFKVKSTDYFVLLQPNAAPCRNLVLHGTEATGKSAITEQLLETLAEHVATESQSGGLKYTIVNAAQCITTRHLFERIVGSVADALPLDAATGEKSCSTPNARPTRQRRCETMAQLSVAMSTMLKEPTRDPRWRFVLVLDAVDTQRDAPPTLLPALARLSEIVSLVMEARDHARLRNPPTMLTKFITDS